MTNGEITTLTHALKIFPAVFQISPANAASAAVFILLAQVETSESEQLNCSKSEDSCINCENDLKLKYRFVEEISGV
jgi:hypothetical protein